MTATGLLRGDGWPAVLIGGAISGLIFGALMGTFAHRMYHRQREAVGAVPADVERAASRASWRGPVPEDPEVRAVALRLIHHQLAEARRRRTFHLVVSTMFVALYVVVAVTRSPWWWLAVAVFAVLLAMTLLVPRRLHRRAEMLRKSVDARGLQGR